MSALALPRGMATKVWDAPGGCRGVDAELVGTDGAWEFRVPPCRDIENQPVEDPDGRWG